MEGKSVQAEYGKEFWCCDGQIFGNAADLEKGIKKMSSKSYSHHANSKKNDFSKWVKDVLKDRTLASELKKSKTKDAAVKCCSKRLSKGISKAKSKKRKR